MKTYKYFWLILIPVFVISCDLTQNPVDTTDRSTVFGSESGLKMYSNSFYDILPDATGVTLGDELSDYGARSGVPSFLRPGAYTAADAGGWGWRNLRNINYFLEHNVNPDIPEGVRLHYNGLARFFRALFYFDKVQRFGDVPLITKRLDVDDPQLWAGRDPRADVMAFVLEDLNFAIEHLNPANNASRTLVTRNVALAYKSRICLFEGTFRKYHTNLNLMDTANDWLQKAADAAGELMASGDYSLFEGGGAEQSYRRLFTTDSPTPSEDILVVVADQELGVLHDANWRYTSATYGPQLSLIRSFINTYLNIDGTPFTDRDGYETMTWIDELEGRDKRLEHTIRGRNYKRISGGEEVPGPPVFSSNMTGYDPIKWIFDDVSYDVGAHNTNSVPLIRYGEILLNYAEAKAEMGTLTDSDWQNTIGRLRARAGITGGLTTRPTEADPYLQSTYFPEVTDPVILEVRRERGIELVLEGQRFDDVRRWRRGELMAMEWNGFYVPSANEHIDINGDGNFNVYFYMQSPPFPRISGVHYLAANGDGRELRNVDHGEILWRTDVPREWEDKKYLFPIPEQHLLVNPGLGQNPGW